MLFDSGAMPFVLLVNDNVFEFGYVVPDEQEEQSGKDKNPVHRSASRWSPFLNLSKNVSLRLGWDENAQTYSIGEG